MLASTCVAAAATCVAAAVSTAGTGSSTAEFSLLKFACSIMLEVKDFSNVLSTDTCTQGKNKTLVFGFFYTSDAAGTTHEIEIAI
jgi:hypothetical protein